MDLGALGIACQKLGEAEVMADAGLVDIMIPSNIVGALKIERLAKLARRTNLTVSVDSFDVAHPIGEYFSQQGSQVNIVIEMTSELNRCGVTTTSAAVALAGQIDQAPGLCFQGVLIYPSNVRSFELVTEAVAALRSNGLPVNIVSGGGSPAAYRSHELSGLTEIRVGTYIFNDWSYVRAGVCTQEQCALKVIVTVVSAPTDDRVIVDGGSKTFSSDVGLPMGQIMQYPDATMHQMSEEHGFVDTSKCLQKPKIGEKLILIPNHACGTLNMHDSLIGYRHDQVDVEWGISARGRVQ
jgi:D-serine deaminase-like pyridoxal phosphate-dependent protein